MNSIKQDCNYRPSSQSMQVVNYSNLSPSTYSNTTSCSLSISPQNMMINTNQLYLANSAGSSNSPSSSSSASSTSSMSPLQNPNKSDQYGSNTSDQYLDMSMSEECMYNSQNNMSINNPASASSGNSNKVNRFFADGVVDILNKWFIENQNYPYPDENMTNILAKEANISAKQVRKWFANKRVRSNKCCKQSVKVKRESKNRRQTKSVSEADNFQLTFNMTDSDEFNMTYNEENLNESVNQRQFHHSKKNNKRNSYCLNNNNNNNNNTVFMDSSSPVFTSDYNTRKFNENNLNNNESLYECFEDEIRNKQQQELLDSYKYNLIQNQSDQNQTNASLLCNNFINSSESSNQLVNLAAAICSNPFVVIQLLQNQTLQTALANQIINNNNNNNNNNLNIKKELNTNEEKLAFKSTYNKRKTHLTNLFDRETSELSIDLSATNVKQEQVSFHNQTKCSNSSTSSSVDPEEFNTTPTSTSSSSSSSYTSPLTMFEQFKSEPSIQTNSIKPTRRINFGDISDLIN